MGCHSVARGRGSTPRSAVDRPDTLVGSNLPVVFKGLITPDPQCTNGGGIVWIGLGDGGATASLLRAYRHSSYIDCDNSFSRKA
jgi:hypothetical protein